MIFCKKCSFNRLLIAGLSLSFLLLGLFPCHANPTGGNVAQGAASFNTSGSTLTINQSSSTAYINWSSFNIGAGETTTFVQPSSTSITWNQINDSNPSQILGSLNANGYIVLQNQSGFYVGGQAAITAHGLILTTAPISTPDFSSGGAWSFNTPPPTAKIINYGQINIAGGGSAYLIANDIENHGTISAPAGKIGLYAGEQVLVSTSPDGRGLSAEVTLPQGSVDNDGKLVADAGNIALQAQVVNQGGLVQANSVRDVNGTIELVASDSVNLGADSTISAQGDNQGVSSGGSVTIQSGNTFSDQIGSTIDVSGGAQGGNGGQVEISAPNPGNIQSQVNGHAADGFLGGTMTIDPTTITLNSATESSYNNMITAGGLSQFTVSADEITVSSSWTTPASLSQLNLVANDMITFSTLWSLLGANSSSSLNLTADNDITFNNGSGINAGSDWNVNLSAGAGFIPTVSQPVPVSGSDGIYLNGNAYLQTQNGDINLNAANEVIVNSGAVRTVNGGNINVTAQYGNVNSGNNINGFVFGQKNAPYYTVNSANLGGISTAAGGNVTITAGGNVISFLPAQNNYSSAKNDAGTGAFGSQPGNVTITAGGNVYGHYVVANGQGTITAGGNIGAPTTDNNLQDDFALSLITGGWSVYAPNGNIYVQDVRNPNGIFGEKLGFNESNYAGYHYFDYSPSASLLLDAGGSVEITGNSAPNSPPSLGGVASIPMLLPPSFQVSTGPGGDFTLDTSVILFPSPNQYLNLQIGGDFIGVPNGNPVNLEMSDSSATRWLSDGNPPTFGITDHATTPPEMNNPNPAIISVAGNMEEVNIYADEQTHVTVGGNMMNCGFSGENLHPDDVTYVHVTGSIVNSPLYSFEALSTKITSANPSQPGLWDSVFDYAINPDRVTALENLDVNDPTIVQQGLLYYLKLNGYLLFPSSLSSSQQIGINPGFIYDPSSLQLGFKGNISSLLTASQISALEGGKFTVILASSSGQPIVNANGHLELTTYNFTAASAIPGLVAESQNSTTTPSIGLLIGGPGQFNITANSMDLGYSQGITSYGFGGDFASLEGVSGELASGGVAINLQVAGNINMITSSIGSIDGGDVTVNAGGAINVSQGTFDFQTSECYGIYTTGHSDVNVMANGDINVGSGCIGAFNGGDVFIESYDGSVNAGTGVNKALDLQIAQLDPVTGLPLISFYGSLSTPASLLANPAPYGSGILAEYPTPKYQTPGGSGEPGNITVLTPNGNIVSAQGGIAQFALDQNTAGGPTVTLVAGTSGVEATPDQGNIILGVGGVVGGTINVTAQGNVQGLIISRQDANISAVQSFSGTVLAGGSANFTGGGNISGTVVGIGGINTGSSSLGNATLLSQNISSGNGSSYSSLATSVATSTASQSAAQQASSDAKQQVASDDESSDDEKKKKKPTLQHIKRVTVILPKAS